MIHTIDFLRETAGIAARLDTFVIEQMAKELHKLRLRHGRLFLVGLGGSAANCSHMANDLRKLTEIDAYAITDNVAELTARANDEGWSTIFSGWLQFATANDALMVMSVGGGQAGVSLPLCKAIDKAKSLSMRILGIVGKENSYTQAHANCCIVIPTQDYPERVTPHAEAFQAVIWHCLVSHPDLQVKATKW